MVSGDKLTESDKTLLREHPTNLFRILQKLNMPLDMCYAVWQHHEKYDGTGYPMGLMGEKIRLSARIVSVANHFDNMVNKNPYNQEVMLQDEVLEYMAASTEFDAECVKALFNIVATYPVGVRVELSNGETGIVIRNNKSMPLRPLVAVGNRVYNLFEHIDITIVKRL